MKATNRIGKPQAKRTLLRPLRAPETYNTADALTLIHGFVFCERVIFCLGICEWMSVPAGNLVRLAAWLEQEPLDGLRAWMDEVEGLEEHYDRPMAMEFARAEWRELNRQMWEGGLRR